MEPGIYRFPGGWAVTADGFATFALTKEEALRQFRRHQPEVMDEAEAIVTGQRRGEIIASNLQLLEAQHEDHRRNALVDSR